MQGITTSSFPKPILCLLVLLNYPGVSLAQRYAHVEYQGEQRYARVSGDRVHFINGPLFPEDTKKRVETGKSAKLTDVVWLPPSDAKKVFAVGMNFASHSRSAASAPPPLFLKLPSSLVGHESTITLPKDANNVHFEGELVLVIGKQANKVAEDDAEQYIFGVTAGNDLTERNWQASDLQWLRAKASDGFGPVGPVIATDIDYNNVLLTTRLNGKVVQQENTENMIHSPAKVVSYLSQYFTLEPGDLIFMGTPGRTQALHNGDSVSVHIEGVGTLMNQIESVH